MGYQGLETTSQEDYIFSDVTPYNPEFDLDELKIIEDKLKNYKSGISTNGLTPYEAEMFLDWITFNARSYAVRNIPESAITSAMTGQCAPTQRINVELLQKLGLNAKSFNTGNCIENVEGIEKDNFFGSKAVRHSISLVDIPIIDNNGNTAEYKYLLDPTFRQFCIKENCNEERYVNPVNGCVAPHPGYFMQKENLRKLGVNEQTAKETENLGKFLVSKGYFYLDESSAKLYGDTFVRASKRIDAQNIPINMSGKQYIENFENIHMELLKSSDKKDVQYLKLPSEIENQKQGLFSRIKQFFTERFGNKTKMLTSGNNTEKVEIPVVKQAILESARLTTEQMQNFREGETQILNNCNGDFNRQQTIEEEHIK